MLKKNDLQDVVSNGGFSIKPLDMGLVKSLEDEMKKLFGQQNSDNDEFLGSLNACTDDRIAQLFDIFNCCGNILSGHHIVQKNYVETVFENPLIWTYPNVRIDKVSRDKFAAPPHLDEWILFNENRGLVAWFPLFSDGYLKIYDCNDKLKIIKDKYWGLKVKNINSFQFTEYKINRGKVLFFRSDLLHESSLKIEKGKVRVSIQYRYLDLMDYDNYFKRPVVQKISDLIKTKQNEIAEE